MALDRVRGLTLHAILDLHGHNIRARCWGGLLTRCLLLLRRWLLRWLTPHNRHIRFSTFGDRSFENVVRALARNVLNADQFPSVNAETVQEAAAKGTIPLALLRARLMTL